MHRIKIAFVLSLAGIIFLTTSGLTVAGLMAYGIRGLIIVIGSGIILFLIIGAGLMLSTNKSKVTAGSIIILAFSGISSILGVLGIMILNSYGRYLYRVFPESIIYFIEGTFFSGAAFLLAGGIGGLVWKPPAPLSLPSSTRTREIEAEIKKYEKYLEKLEQLKKNGEISKEIYEKLKAEYEKKIEGLIDKWKK